MSKLDEYRLWVLIQEQEEYLNLTKTSKTRPSGPMVGMEVLHDMRSQARQQA